MQLYKEIILELDKQIDELKEENKDLKEKLSNEVGAYCSDCPYCHNVDYDSSELAEDIMSGEYQDDIFSVQIYKEKELRMSDQLNILEEYQKINFCPICGRKLEVNNND